MNYKQTALIIDDEKRITFELKEFFEINDYETFRAHSVKEGIELLKQHHIDILIQDIKLPDGSGLDILKMVKTNFPNTDVVMISGHGDMDTVIEAMRKGATDYLKKPFTHNDILIALERINNAKESKRKLNILSEQKAFITDKIIEQYQSNIVTNSPKSKVILEQIIRLSKFDNINILLSGETGTGKEVLANLIHNMSERKDNLIVPVNCSAIPETMFESEFFGYEKGAFTGAEISKKGFFQMADKGTLFLDEIGDMPYSIQSKLLRAIELQQFYPLGSEKPVTVDVKIISATNRDLNEMIHESSFRSDLYHRLNGFTINIPPLRERVEDIEQLTYNFIKQFANSVKKEIPGIDDSVFKFLRQQRFDGNIRELKNIVEKAMIFCDSSVLTLSHFGFYTNSPDEDRKVTTLNLEENEISLITQALIKTQNNQSSAAKLLGISRHALIRRVEKYNLS
ncbi:MAG: hypothetical protein B6226_03195 [Candidatus Cloacimonetes bacterium 4572_65]|nr:MAG: hypothetical protein B6226_03195 [Candidatus Cloacimonetes bacterium 4572_65]